MRTVFSKIEKQMLCISMKVHVKDNGQKSVYKNHFKVGCLRSNFIESGEGRVVDF